MNLGVTMPFSPGNFTQSYNTGYNGGIGIGWGISRNFQLVLDANVDIFPFKFLDVTGTPVTGGRLLVGTLLANARLRFTNENNPFVPYFIGGLGPAYVNRDALESAYVFFTHPASSSINFALRLGIGLDLKLNDSSSLFLESNVIGVPNTYEGSLIHDSFRLGAKFSR